MRTEDSSHRYGVSEDFLNNLNKLALRDSSWWRDVLECKDVFIAVRHNSLDVYHRGGSIFQICDVGNGTVRPNTHVKYLVRQQEIRVELEANNKFKLPDKGVAWESYEGNETLRDMLSAARTLAGPEKSGLHPLVVGSTNVIDVEISLPAVHPQPDQTLSRDDGNQASKSYDRLDAATLEQQGNDIYVVFHEAKHFSNLDLAAKAGGTPKVIEQILRYQSTIEYHEEFLKKRYRSVCRTLERLDAMRRQARSLSELNPLIQKVAQENFKLRIEYKPRLIVFGFDANQRDGRWKAYLENITRADPDLHVYDAGNPKTATGAFRSPTPKRVKKVTPALSSKN